MKRERARQALIEVLPPYDQLNAILNSNSEWWATWRKKTTGTSGNLTLPQYAAHALLDGSPAAVGILVLSVGVCSESDDTDRYISTVDRWVLSDDEYAATLEGMECLILEAKWYADIGQPRRAWLANRRGLMYAQLMVCVKHCNALLGVPFTDSIARGFIANAPRQRPTRAFGGHCTMSTAFSACFLDYLTGLATRTVT